MFTVNHEKIPSSAPSMISTALSGTRNSEDENTPRTASNKLSDSAFNNNRNPAVAFNTIGVDGLNSSGTNVLALTNSSFIESAAC